MRKKKGEEMTWKWRKGCSGLVDKENLFLLNTKKALPCKSYIVVKTSKTYLINSDDGTNSTDPDYWYLWMFRLGRLLNFLDTMCYNIVAASLKACITMHNNDKLITSFELSSEVIHARYWKLDSVAKPWPLIFLETNDRRTIIISIGLLFLFSETLSKASVD